MNRAPANPRPSVPRRSRLAVAVGRLVAAVSRLTHLGSGSVIGGRASLLIDKQLLAHLAAGRDVALVSATNGKTTTTRLLAAGLATDRPVVSNTLGANMPPGHVAALGSSAPGTAAVLEVDERWLARVMADTRPSTVLLLNLSRDQLDRSHEVRDIAARWRTALAETPPSHVVANADDPLVTWAAAAAPVVEWVGAGSAWHADATGCPACGGRLEFDDNSWWCNECDLRRPKPTSVVDNDGDRIERRDASSIDLQLALPGRANRANAAMALAAATLMGAEPDAAVRAMRRVHDVAGRYRTVAVDGTDVRLLLAKNPAGWQEAIDMLQPAPAPVVVSINARVADGHDPSWLWDVPFERLRGRRVIAAGERRRDLAVRLQYGEVEHVTAGSLREAVRLAGADELDLAANYTAFQEYLEEVGG